MGSRLQLQSLLEDLLGSRNVYYQPPESLKLKYPCIIYSRGSIEKTTFANNLPYQQMIRYAVTIVDRDPDSEIPKKIAQLPMCVYERSYAADNLNHTIYNLYY